MKELMSQRKTPWAAYEAKPGRIFHCLDIRQNLAVPAISSFSTESAICRRSGPLCRVKLAYLALPIGASGHRHVRAHAHHTDRCR